MDIAEHCDSFKASPASEAGTSQTQSGNVVEIVRTIGRLPINPTAKLVAITMRTTRITDSKTLANMLGLSLRVVQRSKNEYSDASDTSDTYVANPTNPATPTSLSVAPRAPAPAQKELPSGVYLSQEVASSACEVEEIPGLNGSTPMYVGWLAGFLKGDHGIADHEASRAILAGSVDAYGPDKVRAGLIELKTEIASGTKFRDIGKAFSSFVKNAQPAKADQPPKLSKIDEQIAKARALMSPQARADAEARNGRLAS